MHLHAIWATPGIVEPVTGLQAPDSEEALRKQTIAALERYNIVKAVTSGPFVKGYKAAAPERIVVGLDDVTPTAANVRDCATAKTCELIAEFAPQYAGTAPTAAELAPSFELAERLDVPVGLHMGLGPPGAAYIGNPQYRMHLSNPLLLEDVLVAHPKLRLYVMHAGWPFGDEMVGLLYAHPQVYVDIAVINWVLPKEEFHAYLRRLVRAGFAKRIMFGSDQMFWPDSIGRAIEAVESADFLTTEQKRDIFYNNAVRFLRLDLAVGIGPRH